MAVKITSQNKKPREILHGPSELFVGRDQAGPTDSSADDLGGQQFLIKELEVV
jgi:hypothetical protein